MRLSPRMSCVLVAAAVATAAAAPASASDSNLKVHTCTLTAWGESYDSCRVVATGTVLTMTCRTYNVGASGVWRIDPTPLTTVDGWCDDGPVTMSVVPGQVLFFLLNQPWANDGSGYVTGTLTA